MLTVDEALAILLEQVQPLDGALVGLQESLGHFLSAEIASDIDSPPFDKSLMDGYAIQAIDFQDEAGTELPACELRVIEEIVAGVVGQKTVRRGDAARIMTGAPMPNGTDAVVPIEQTECDETNDQGTTETVRMVASENRSVRVGNNVLRRGTVMRAGEIILPAGRLLRAQELAVLAEMGVSRVPVRRKPTVAVLATGDELVPVDQSPGLGQIRNSNETLLAAQIEQAGGTPVLLGIARDDRDDLRAKILRGLQHDLLLLSGGVSAGILDLVPSELEAAGVRKLFHRVSVKPGKPIWFGIKEAGTTEERQYIFGLPGNPVSSMVCFRLFVQTAIRRLMGDLQAVPSTFSATLADDFFTKSVQQRVIYFPAIWSHESGSVVVHLVDWKGSADLRSPAESNGLAVFPAGIEQFPAGTTIDVITW